MTLKKPLQIIFASAALALCALAPAGGALAVTRLVPGRIAMPSLQDEPTPGQSKANYDAWIAASPERQRQVAAFTHYLATRRLDRTVPVWQLFRTSSMWEQCGATPFEVAPPETWGHVAATLRFVRDKVVPAIGPVEVLSGYRNEKLNRCSEGAPRSAHRLFYALDLMPLAQGMTRTRMIDTVCTTHIQYGAAYNAGLGFYSGLRFHVDSSGYRRWGPDGRGVTSPCVKIAQAKPGL